MKAAGEDILHVWVGGDEPNIFEYWTWWDIKNGTDYLEQTEFLKNVGNKTYRGYGLAFYHSRDKIWFRYEQDLLAYMLKFGAHENS